MARNDDTSTETTDERRAEWERFSMTVCSGAGGGYVNIRNDSHNNPGDHIYSVHVTDGRADGCSCKHATYRDAHCKHQIVVEQRPLVLASADAASAASTVATGKQVATDGGAVVKSDENGDTDEQSRTDHWDNPVEHFDDEAVGAGEKRECKACSSRFKVAMVAATAENSRNWEEFYECQNCGATGSFRFDGGREDARPQRTWTGQIAYPEE